MLSSICIYKYFELFKGIFEKTCREAHFPLGHHAKGPFPITSATPMQLIIHFSDLFARMKQSECKIHTTRKTLVLKLPRWAVTYACNWNIKRRTEKRNCSGQNSNFVNYRSAIGIIKYLVQVKPSSVKNKLDWFKNSFPKPILKNCQPHWKVNLTGTYILGSSQLTGELEATYNFFPLLQIKLFRTEINL